MGGASIEETAVRARFAGGAAVTAAVAAILDDWVGAAKDCVRLRGFFWSGGMSRLCRKLNSSSPSRSHLAQLSFRSVAKSVLVLIGPTEARSSMVSLSRMA